MNLELDRSLTADYKAAHQHEGEYLTFTLGG
jgi:hypothetical protein